MRRVIKFQRNGKRYHAVVDKKSAFLGIIYDVYIYSYALETYSYLGDYTDFHKAFKKIETAWEKQS